MALATVTITNRLVNAGGVIINGQMAGNTKSIRFSRGQQAPAFAGIMARGTLATGHRAMGTGLKQSWIFRALGGVATHTRAVDNVIKMSLTEGLRLAIMTA